MAATSDRQRLIEIVRQRSYGTGVSIKLASGRISDFYFDMKPTMLHPEGGHLVGRLIVSLLVDRSVAAEIDMVGGLEMGAVPVATAVSIASHVMTVAAATDGCAPPHALPAFFVRKERKGHGTGASIDGLVRGDSIAGKRVLVLEDVTTTGGSALKAIEVVREAGAIVVGVVTIVDRQEGAAEAFAAAGIAFWPLMTAADFR